MSMATRVDRNLSGRVDLTTSADTEYNKQQVERALNGLRSTLMMALESGWSGAFGVRVPLQRGRLGNIRQVMEIEH